MRIEALIFLKHALASHPPTTFQPHVKVLIPPVVALADDRYYKTVSEALRVLSEIVQLLRPEPPASSFAYESHVPVLYGVVERRLQAQDQDQEVKECAITCMGSLVYHLADHPAVNLTTILPLLLERMRNEITRVTTVKTFALIAGAKLDVKLATPANGGPVLQLAVTELCAFLRKSNRPLRQASLTALDVLIGKHSSALPDADVATTIQELSALVTDADLHVAHLALTLGKTITITKSSTMVQPLKEILLPKALTLLQSSLLQGVALRSLLQFLGQLVAAKLPGCGFDELTTLLLNLPSSSAGGSSALNRHSLSALSQAVASCCSKAEPSQASKMVSTFAQQLSSGGPGGSVLALLCLGEIGRLMDLSSTHASLLKTVITSFDAPEEETRNAASFALGNIAAGNLSAFVPTLLSTMEAASAHDYLVSIKHLRSKTSSSTCQPSHSHSLTHLTSLPPHHHRHH